MSRDKASFMNNPQDTAITAAGIEVGAGVTVAAIADILKFAGVPL